jgi:hypothetical protein
VQLTVAGVSMFFVALLLAQQPPSAPSSLDYEYFKTKV